MKRREFVTTSGCGLAALFTSNATLEAQQTPDASKPADKPAQSKPKGWKPGGEDHSHCDLLMKTD